MLRSWWIIGDSFLIRHDEDTWFTVLKGLLVMTVIVVRPTAASTKLPGGALANFGPHAGRYVQGDPVVVFDHARDKRVPCEAIRDAKKLPSPDITTSGSMSWGPMSTSRESSRVEHSLAA